MLHHGGTGRRADGIQGPRPRLAFGLRPDLDQFMGPERAFDFGQYRAGQALVADQHDRIKRMGAGTQGAPRGG